MRHSFRTCHLDPLRIWTDLHISFTAVHSFSLGFGTEEVVWDQLLCQSDQHLGSKTSKWVGCENRNEGLGTSQTDATKQFFILPKAGWCPWNFEFHPKIWLKGHTAIKEKLRTEISLGVTSEESRFQILKDIWLATYCLSPGAAKLCMVAEHVVLRK